MGEEDGKWIGEWVYENEVRGRCVREDRDGMTVVYDENGGVGAIALVVVLRNGSNDRFQYRFHGCV